MKDTKTKTILKVSLMWRQVDKNLVKTDTWCDVLIEKIEKIISKFSKLSDKRKADILLYGINLDCNFHDYQL